MQPFPHRTQCTLIQPLMLRLGVDIVIPPGLFCPETCVGDGIIKAALGFLVALAA